MEKKTCAFKAEIRQMLDLVINSLYSKKEIFLRELISNASDAIDRAQYLALTDKTLVADNPEWKIDIIADAEEKTLTVVDNGIGMNAEELENNLGVIARSGTKSFVQKLSEDKAANLPELIGQFGVGFYAAFMVAEEVTVITRHRGEAQQGCKWTSNGDGNYTLEDAARDQPGTTIVLKLREGMDEFLDKWRIETLVKQYSDFIAYPIRFGEKGEPPAADAKPMNTMKALWKRPKSEIKPEEYNEFYKHISRDFNDPFKTIHLSVEGAIEFKALLFLPKELSYDLLMPNHKYGLNLYVRNVFIGSDFEMLLPDYLRFTRGVVDSSDLPLNVSREMLQDDAIIRKIKSNITGKILSTLAEMMKDSRVDYETFFTSFGRILKEGLHTDWDNSDKLKNLLLFATASSDGAKQVSLKEYIDAMPETQQDIYYLIAEDMETAKQSPHLEALRKRGYDVLLMTDPIDQWIIDRLDQFDGKKLVAIDKGKLEFGSDAEREAEKKQLEAATADYKPLIDYIQGELDDDVKEVRLSPRLTDSACCLVADENAMSASMERMLRAMKQDIPKQKRLLELNPSHPLIKRMKEMLDTNQDDAKLHDYIDLLFGQALLSEGSALKDPRRFTQLVADLMAKA
ncbi:MAG: molecular chaperone HtpG [Kiritimatiellae bacterium]|nr:molecular chaperone HtpG [Kiritimatiellia bacterium]